MNKGMTKRDFELTAAIAARADKMGIMGNDRMTLMIDLELAYEEFDLRLEDLLKANDYEFSHDVTGIQNNINRRSKEFENCFLPRFATQGGDR